MLYSDGNPSPPASANTQDAEYKRVMDRYKKAKGRWNSWSDVWEEIYDYVLPHRESFFQEFSGQRRTENIYDETAVVGLPKFASRLQLGFFRLMAEHSNWHRVQSSQTINNQKFWQSLIRSLIFCMRA